MYLICILYSVHSPSFIILTGKICLRKSISGDPWTGFTRWSMDPVHEVVHGPGPCFVYVQYEQFKCCTIFVLEPNWIKKSGFFINCRLIVDSSIQLNSIPIFSPHPPPPPYPFPAPLVVSALFTSLNTCHYKTRWRKFNQSIQ